VIQSLLGATAERSLSIVAAVTVVCGMAMSDPPPSVMRFNVAITRAPAPLSRTRIVNTRLPISSPGFGMKKSIPGLLVTLKRTFADVDPIVDRIDAEDRKSVV